MYLQPCNVSDTENSTAAPDLSLIDQWTNAYNDYWALSLIPAVGIGLGSTLGAAAPYVATTLGVAAKFDPEPISKAILAISAVLTTLFAKVFSGCGQTCVAATQIANQVEDALKQNLQVYMASPVHLASLQAQAIGNFDYAWSKLVQGCSNPTLGATGQRCISERQRGGTAPWCPNAGHTGCDWFALYRDPIANDPHVVADPSPVADLTSGITSGITSIFGGSGSGISGTLLIAAGLALAAVVMGDR